LVNAHFTRTNKKFDLIHCAHCISRNRFPWVCDIEFANQFWASGSLINSSSRKKVLKYLKAPYCKKILAWSEWSKNSILKSFPEVESKIGILYPAVPLALTKKSFSKNANLLFVGRDFYMKGGEITLRVFDKLTKKYDNISATIVSDVPEKIVEKYKSNKKIKFYGLMSHEKLFEEIYPNADIFVYPTFSDTFGFAILEAQSFGLPVVAMRTKSTHTINETIKDGKTGFVVDNLEADAVNRVASKKVFLEIKNDVEKLIKNKRLLKNMSSNCLREIRGGKFSIKRRNEVLKRVYEGCF